MKPCGFDKAPRDCMCCLPKGGISTAKHGKPRHKEWTQRARRLAKRSEKNKMMKQINFYK